MCFVDEAMPDGRADRAAEYRRVPVKKTIAGLAGLIGTLVIAVSANAMTVPAGHVAASPAATQDVTTVQYRHGYHHRHYVRHYHHRYHR